MLGDRVMKTKKEMLEYYGKCCVSEYCLCENKDYPAGEKGKSNQRRDSLKIENIRDQKKAIEFIFERTAN